MGIKRVNAVLESKTEFVQTEGSFVNYGMMSSIFASSEKSGSFLDKKKRHVFVFDIDGEKKEFDVSKETYDKYSENEKGMLEYKGASFLGFVLE